MQLRSLAVSQHGPVAAKIRRTASDQRRARALLGPASRVPASRAGFQYVVFFVVLLVVLFVPELFDLLAVVVVSCVAGTVELAE